MKKSYYKFGNLFEWRKFYFMIKLWFKKIKLLWIKKSEVIENCYDSVLL